MFNAERFAQMKPGSVFINTARGPVMDAKALRAALEPLKNGIQQQNLTAETGDQVLENTVYTRRFFSDRLKKIE